MPQQQRHKRRLKEADIQSAKLAIEQCQIQLIRKAEETYNVSKHTLVIASMEWLHEMIVPLI